MCKVLWRFDQISQSYKVAKFRNQLSDVIPANLQDMLSLVSFAFFFLFLFLFYRGKASYKVYSVFDHFYELYEVAKFRMVKLYLDVSDVIHANEHTKLAICALHVNLWNFLSMSFCFCNKKR